MENNKNKENPKFLRANGIAEHLSVSRATVWLYAKQGKITPIKLSPRVTVFEVAEVEKALFGGVL